VELRQYLLRRGRRDELIELFDREFVESQEECGMRVVGQFRDVDRVNHVVWLRGFASHDARVSALSAFYGGPVWARWGPAANATMIDWGDVLLLSPHGPGDHQLSPHPSRPVGGSSPNRAIILVIAHRSTGREEDEDSVVLPALDRLAADAGLTTLGVYETDPSPNGFPALPVRRSDCLVWIAEGKADSLDATAERWVTARADPCDLGCRERGRGDPGRRPATGAHLSLHPVSRVRRTPPEPYRELDLRAGVFARHGVSGSERRDSHTSGIAASSATAAAMTQPAIATVGPRPRPDMASATGVVG
jgi:hypothetical protein